MKQFIAELQTRGMVHQYTPLLNDVTDKLTAYVGFDPTAKSLHVGNLVAIMLLKHLQLNGHRPIILIGGATGMIGDPSGKKDERQFLTLEILFENQRAITKQLSKYLDLSGMNAAVIVNNYDWVSQLSLMDFLRGVGKNSSVNVMMNRDSVKNRIEDPNSSISFTEFTYQLIQAFDFAHLHKYNNCSLQMGGSDQWGNMTAGIDLIRRMYGNDAYALTCPLLTKSDGNKMGKSEKGNIWLDSELTSTFEFFQYWYNLSDEDASKFIPYFTLLPMDEINSIREQHLVKPENRLLQLVLAKAVTLFVHGQVAVDEALHANAFLYNDANLDSITTLSAENFKSIFLNVPNFKLQKKDFDKGDLFDVLSVSKNNDDTIFKSKSDVRRMQQSGGLYINKERVHNDFKKSDLKLLHGRYLIVQKGKKNFNIIEIIDNLMP